jgi:predicted RNA-binding protein
MCIATVYVDIDGELKEAMRDVIYIEAENSRFQLVNLLGEEKYLKGKLSTSTSGKSTLWLSNKSAESSP